ncbi:MAG TPA: gamma-glutamyl-gamma-aminobutyrate hydrolase family protein [Pararhizobium sp.]|uniref:gamma-glutamyl-gamma-aminobutyrate hydrolase family protein n=1 Tax=Pararhizobium sp. TaxID=1977563 RepID=UPI002B5F4FDC|nr:gamma-glutamyl-gamma-aminobutyrate hydrolase family protein [Pararhizobium sp.]HTO34226.1 gamma-glutamyl-gamma-aminobutyrate hydrolase family protein [Pararhizobium sp.]
MLFTGAVSNVHPAHFDPRVEQDRHAPFDEGRDSIALALSRLAIERDIPLLAICRGLQELNVACGGTLKAGIVDDPRSHSHPAWNPNGLPHIVYGPAHEIRIMPGGQLHGLARDRVSSVNSVHVQAIGRLGQGLIVEATADDGTIEAISVAKAAFILGVQWHPEYDGAGNSLSRGMFAAFGAAVKAYQERKRVIDRVADRIAHSAATPPICIKAPAPIRRF